MQAFEKYVEWEKVTEEEIYAYFGFMILIGLVKMPSIRDYWRRDEEFHYNPLASRISRSRFLELNRFLHFVNNDSLPEYGEPTYSKIQKVKPILTYMSTRSETRFVLGRDIAIDEAMVKYKGRSSIKQYMPKKPIKRGFKIWMMADSSSGYVAKYQVYEGKSPDGTVEVGLGGKVVLKMSENLQGRYHHLFFDNFFTGIDLMLTLLKQGTFASGTIRVDRKGYPSAFKPIVKKGLAKRGDFRHAVNGNLAVAV